MDIRQIVFDAVRTVRRERQVGRNRSVVEKGTRDGNIFFARELESFLGREQDWLVEAAREYRNCEAAWRYLSGLRSPTRKTDGVAKSLDVAEGFAVWSLVKHIRPRVVVELGVQFGVSSRLWKEALKKYVPDHTLILCDLVDRRRFIRDDECTFLRGDAYKILPEVMKSHTVDVLHNDAHPYRLIQTSVEDGLRHKIKNFTFHDVGRGPRNHFLAESATLSTEEKLTHSEDIATYGVWERHVMAEIFDERILRQDAVDTDDFAIQIFDSFLGFGAVRLKEKNASS